MTAYFLQIVVALRSYGLGEVTTNNPNGRLGLGPSKYLDFHIDDSRQERLSGEKDCEKKAYASDTLVFYANGCESDVPGCSCTSANRTSPVASIEGVIPPRTVISVRPKISVDGSQESDFPILQNRRSPPESHVKAEIRGYYKTKREEFGIHT